LVKKETINKKEKERDIKIKTNLPTGNLLSNRGPKVRYCRVLTAMHQGKHDDVVLTHSGKVLPIPRLVRPRVSSGAPMAGADQSD
jgi:hypothetical protein